MDMEDKFPEYNDSENKCSHCAKLEELLYILLKWDQEDREKRQSVLLTRPKTPPLVRKILNKPYTSNFSE